MKKKLGKDQGEMNVFFPMVCIFFGPNFKLKKCSLSAQSGTSLRLILYVGFIPKKTHRKEWRSPKPEFSAPPGKWQQREEPR